MRLPNPPNRYDPQAQAALQRTLEQEDTNNFKRGTDLALGKERIILLSPNGTRYAITVSNTGVLSAVAV